MTIRLKLLKIPEKVIYNSGSTISDPISESFEKFGNQIGGELFLQKHQNGKYFAMKAPIGLAFYSTTVASSYNYWDKFPPFCAANECPLKLYIDQEVNTLHGDQRGQPMCECDPENHIHIFRLPFFYFLIDGKQNRDIIEILRTLKKHKIYTHSTNTNPNEMNLADKLIKLSQRNFEDEDTLRSVWNILTDFNELSNISQYIENHKKFRNSGNSRDSYP